VEGRKHEISCIFFSCREQTIRDKNEFDAHTLTTNTIYNHRNTEEALWDYKEGFEFSLLLEKK